MTCNPVAIETRIPGNSISQFAWTYGGFDKSNNECLLGHHKKAQTVIAAVNGRSELKFVAVDRELLLVSASYDVRLVCMLAVGSAVVTGCGNDCVLTD